MADETGRQDDQMTDDEPPSEGSPPSQSGGAAESQGSGPPPIESEESSDPPGEEAPSSNVLAVRDELDTADRTSMLTGTRDRLVEVLSATDRAAEAILDAARVEAEEAVRAARAEADEHVRSTHRRIEELTRERMNRLSDVTEDLLGQAETVRQQVETLRGALEGTTSTIAGELGLPDQTPIDSVVVSEAPQLSDPSSQQAPSEPPLDSQEPPPFEAAPQDEQDTQFDVADTEPDYEPATAPPEQEPKRGFFSRLRRSKPAEEGSQTIDSNAIDILIMQMLAGGADRTEIEHRLRTEFQIDDPTALLDAVGPFAAER